MTDMLMKIIPALLSVLSPCPLWVRLLVFLWIACAGILVVVFLGYLLQPSARFSRPPDIKRPLSITEIIRQCPPVMRQSTILWIGYSGILFVIILTYLLFLPSSIHTSRSPDITSHPKPSSADIVILQPTQNGEVEETAIVQFHSVHSELHHYIVVIPMQSPNRWIVDGPLQVANNGTGTGRACFGSGSVGVGERFTIVVLASAVLLPEGILTRTPAGSQLSQYITVKRVK
ncbi:MAG: hypothetical protein WC047_04185 [Kiritimatiellales bacterium]